jgi:hypothetical protein
MARLSRTVPEGEPAAALVAILLDGVTSACADRCLDADAAPLDQAVLARARFGWSGRTSAASPSGVSSLAIPSLCALLQRSAARSARVSQRLAQLSCCFMLVVCGPAQHGFATSPQPQSRTLMILQLAEVRALRLPFQNGPHKNLVPRYDPATNLKVAGCVPVEAGRVASGPLFPCRPGPVPAAISRGWARAPKGRAPSSSLPIFGSPRAAFRDPGHAARAPA